MLPSTSIETQNLPIVKPAFKNAASLKSCKNMQVDANLQTFHPQLLISPCCNQLQVPVDHERSRAVGENFVNLRQNLKSRFMHDFLSQD